MPECDRELAARSVVLVVMRVRYAIVLLSACAPPTATSTPPVAETPVVTQAPAPEPPPATPEPDPESPPEVEPPTWAWAISVLPALAEHAEQSPSSDAIERFNAWFSPGESLAFYFRDGDACWTVRGNPDLGFSYRETVTRDGNTRTRQAYDLQITAGGISESGPGGTTEVRKGNGWEQIGGFGTGCFQILVHDSMSRVENGVAYFDAYDYTLTAECRGTIEDVQHCEGGGTRTCSRCSGVRLQPHAPNRGWGSAAAFGRSARVDPPPLHDCTQPCPVDEWTPRLEGLNEVLKGRRFYGASASDEGVLYMSKKACQRAAKRVAKRWRDAN